MKRALLAAYLFVLCICSVHAQAQQKTTEPQTKLETFQAKTGVVILRNFTRIGSLRGIGGTVTVTAWEFVDAQTSKKEYGISFEAKESGDLERENRAYVDYDEIDSLLKGIDYVSGIEKSVTKLTNFQADYRTKGDLRISVFNDSEGIEAGIYVGGVGAVSVFFKLESFKDVRKLIVDAKAAIDGIR